MAMILPYISRKKMEENRQDRTKRVGLAKNYSAEDGIDETNGYFRRNSGCSAEQKTF
jgi:hypothetical protein